MTMMETALAEILRALRQDRSHVVLVVSKDLMSQLVTQLTKELKDTMRVATARFKGRKQSSAAQCVLSALGVPGAEEASFRARTELERLGRAGTTLTIIVPAALSVDPTVLRELGELAMSTGDVLRLALIAERADDESENPVAKLVAALGTGAAKIDVVPPRRPPRDIPTSSFEPIEAIPSREPRTPCSIPVRAERPLHRRVPRVGRGLVAASLVAVAGLSIWALPAGVVPETLSVLPPVSSVGARVVGARLSLLGAETGAETDAETAVETAPLQTMELDKEPEAEALASDAPETGQPDADALATGSPPTTDSPTTDALAKDMPGWGALSTDALGIDAWQTTTLEIAAARTTTARTAAVATNGVGVDSLQIAALGTDAVGIKTLEWKAPKRSTRKPEPLQTPAAAPSEPAALAGSAPAGATAEARAGIEPAASPQPPVAVAAASPRTDYSDPARKIEPAKATQRTAKPAKRAAKAAKRPSKPRRVALVRVNLNAWPYADIEVDGEPVGPTPIANLPLAPGWHTVRAVFPDGRVSEERVQVDPLQTHFRIP